MNWPSARLSCRIRELLESTIAWLHGSSTVVDGAAPERWQVLLDQCPDDLEIDAELVMNDLPSQSGGLFSRKWPGVAISKCSKCS